MALQCDLHRLRLHFPQLCAAFDIGKKERLWCRSAGSWVVYSSASSIALVQRYIEPSFPTAAAKAGIIAQRGTSGVDLLFLLGSLGGRQWRDQFSRAAPLQRPTVLQPVAADLLWRQENRKLPANRLVHAGLLCLAARPELCFVMHTGRGVVTLSSGHTPQVVQEIADA